MNNPTSARVRHIGVAAAVALTAGLAVAAPAAAVAVPSASVANNTLTILGTGGGDSIVVGIDFANPNTVLVDLGNGTMPQQFDRTTFTAIAAFLGRGDDTFQIAPGTPQLVDEALTVDGDGGNDTITGGFGDDVLNGGAGDDVINGADGDDLIFGNAGDDVVDGARGADTEVLGGGNDTAAWNPGEGSDVVNGGPDYDTLRFNGSNIGETIVLSANGAQAALTRNVALVRMDLDNLEQVDIATFGGADSITVNDLSGTDVSQADLALAATDGGGDLTADSVTVTGTNRADNVNVTAVGEAVDVAGLHTTTEITGAEPTADHLQVNTVGGNDTASVSDAAKAVIGVGVDLGTGQR